MEERDFESDERVENTAGFLMEGHDNQQQSCQLDESQKVFSDNATKGLNAPFHLNVTGMLLCRSTRLNLRSGNNMDGERIG